MHRIALTLAALAIAAIVVPAASADQPTREALSTPDTFTISGSCTFDVRLDTLANKGYLLTFTSGKQIISGRLVVRVTNLSDPSKSLVLQISGPGIEDLAEPFTFNLSGTSLFFFPGTLLLTRGPASITFDESGNVVSFTQTSASSVDICAALS